MPNETKDAVTWALGQSYADPFGNIYAINKSDEQLVIDKVREYFNTNAIAYITFSYDDLKPYLI